MADQWYIGRNNKRSGPFTTVQLREMALTDGLKPTDLVWKDGMAKWVAAAMIKGLFPAPSGARPIADAQRAGVTLEPHDLESAPGESHEIEYADFMQRVAASLLDALFAGLMSCVPMIPVFLFLAAIGAGSDDPSVQSVMMAIGNCCTQLFGLLIGGIYYVVLETSNRQGTWGKQIVGIKVTDLHGNRITVGRALGRYFTRFLSGCTCGIGWLMPLFTDKKQTLHDMVAGCLAIKK